MTSALALVPSFLSESYYFEDGDCIIKAGDSLFKVRRIALRSVVSDP